MIIAIVFYNIELEKNLSFTFKDTNLLPVLKYYIPKINFV